MKNDKSKRTYTLSVPSHNEFIILDENDSHNFILIDNNGNFSIIKAIFPIELQKEINKDKIIFEESIINKKDIDKKLKSIEGIIFIYKIHNKEILGNIIDIIHNIDKKIKEKIFPKIIIGNKLEIISYINKDKDKIKKNFNKIKNIKFLEGSSDMKMDINTALIEFIKIKNIYNKYEKFINDNKINEKLINNIFKNKINLFKCLHCNQVFEIEFDNFSNTILLCCKVCKTEKKIDFLEFEKLKDTVNCEECNKEINLNVNNSYVYCYICKKYICNECTKIHLQKEDKNDNILKQNNLVDIICNIHNKICYNYCLECKINICINCEIESHINHEKELYNEKEIIELISKQKKNLENEKQKYKKIKEIIEDCLNKLKKYFDQLIKYKEKEIIIKENIIKQCEIYKFDKALINNTKNLYFGKSMNIFYNGKDNWDTRLNNILEYFNEPIKIKNTKLCQQDNLKGPFDILRPIKVNNNNINDANENNENLTDLCSLFNYNGKNYFAVSFDSGLLKIYNDDFENRIPLKIIKEFEKNEGINSLNKSTRHSIFLVGNSKIMKIQLSEDLKDYKILNVINIENQLFKNVLELDCFDVLIITNNVNQLICFHSKNGKIINNITKDNEKEKSNEILYLEKISDNKIIIMLHELKLLNIALERDAMNFTLDAEETDINNKALISNNIIYNQNENSDINWKILEFDLNENNIIITKNYLFEKKINYLGKINDQLILLLNKNLKQIIIFDLNSYYNILELPFNPFQEPIISFPLNRRNDLLDLIFICKERYLIQYVFNLTNGLIYPIGKIKINSNNEEIQLLDSQPDITKGNFNEKTDNIVKIISLEKNNFLLVTNENFIYNIKKSN